MWRRTIKPILDKLSSQVQYARHEDKVSPGTPDVDFASNTRGGWIELKVVEAPTTPLSKLSIPHLTLQQKAFLQSRGKCGMFCCVLVQVDTVNGGKDFYLWNWPQLDLLNRPGLEYNRWCIEALAYWPGAINIREFGKLLGVTP